MSDTLLSLFNILSLVHTRVIGAKFIFHVCCMRNPRGNFALHFVHNSILMCGGYCFQVSCQGNSLTPASNCQIAISFWIAPSGSQPRSGKHVQHHTPSTDQELLQPPVCRAHPPCCTIYLFIAVLLLVFILYRSLLYFRVT